MQDELLKILEAQNAMTGHKEGDILALEIEAVEAMANVVLVLLGYDRETLEAHVGNTEQK